VAEDVLQQFDLDRICFIPCALPPHKTLGILAPARDRIEMVRMAIHDRHALTVSDMEIERSGPSYTIDTLGELKAKYGAGAELFFMVGLDAFLEIHTWKSYRRLFDLAAFILMTRPEPDQPVPSLHPSALEYARRHISPHYALADDGCALEHPEKKIIYLAPVTPVAIASSQIRAKIQHGQPIQQWVEPAVSDYIDQKGLYR
jgi:nicotinate-nucleotide adenylyltransferase